MYSFLACASYAISGKLRRLANTCDDLRIFKVELEIEMDQQEERNDKQLPHLVAVPRVLNINWKVPEFIQTLHATNAVVQQRGTEFHLQFFEVLPPIVVGTPQEQAQAYQKMKLVDGTCVARIVLSLENMQGLIQVINESMNNFQEQMRYLEQLSKEQNDDASGR